MYIMADWYIRGSSLNPFDANSYTFVGSTAPSCPGTGNICAVLADNNGADKPILTPDLQTQIQAAQNTNQDQSNVLLRSAT